MPVPVALCGLGPQAFPVNFNPGNLFALPKPGLVPSVDYLLTIPHGKESFKAPFDRKRPIVSEDDDGVPIVGDALVVVNADNVHKLESVDFRPICFVPPAAVPALATLDNPDIASVFLVMHSFFAEELASKQPNFDLAGYLLQWLWALEHGIVCGVYTEPALDKSRSIYCKDLHHKHILQENKHERPENKTEDESMTSVANAVVRLNTTLVNSAEKSEQDRYEKKPSFKCLAKSRQDGILILATKDCINPEATPCQSALEFFSAKNSSEAFIYVEDYLKSTHNLDVQIQSG
jgi:hypothetical protein